MKRGIAYWPVAVLATLTLSGLAFRLRQYGFSLFGDELSTLWIVRGRSFGESLDLVSGDAEITPPLYFVLAWLSARLGDSPELVRLPALVAGTALIPATGLLGARMFNWPAGLIAAGLISLSPSMIYFSGTGRAYPVMLFFLVCSTLAMLYAARLGGRWRWVAFAVCAALAMYSHYTAVFVLAASFLWLLWAFPGRRREAFISVGLATLAFLPWLGSMFADLSSPTVQLLEALQGNDPGSIRRAIEQWALGHPLFPPGALPGRLAMGLVAAGALVAVGRWIAQALRERQTSAVGAFLASRRMAILAVAIAAACPLGEAILQVLGPDLLSSRNLVASWPGLALTGGGLLASIGPVWGGICATAVIAGIGLGTATAVDPDQADPGYQAAADRVNEGTMPGDVVIDVLSAPVSPAPTTPLGLYLDRDVERFTLNHPEGPPPFLAFSPPKPDPELRISDALASADDRVIIIGPETEVRTGQAKRPGVNAGVVVLPAGWMVDSVESVPGLADLRLTEISRTGG